MKPLIIAAKFFSSLATDVLSKNVVKMIKLNLVNISRQSFSDSNNKRKKEEREENSSLSSESCFFESKASS